MEADMSRYDDAMRRLEDAAEGLESLDLQQMTVEPRREREIKKVEDSVKQALELLREREGEREDDRRLADLVEHLIEYTEAAQRRLRVSEERLERIEHVTVVGVGS